MKITKEFILLLIVGILMIINIINVNDVTADVKKYEDKINSLQTNIDSITKLNTEINNKILKLNGDITSITIKVDGVDKKINIIKKNTDEKIRNVDNLNINELQLFFTNRYAKK
jgi:peptidoglycan hydrolase CwlO-like protein